MLIKSKFIIYSLCLLILSGCVSSKSFNTTPVENKSSFYKVGDGKSKSASIFFACGQSKSKSWLMTTNVRIGSCQLSLNGKIYSLVTKGKIGKIDLKPGNYNVAHYGMFKINEEEPITKIRLKSNESILLIANHTQRIPAIGGAINSVNINTIEVDNYDVISKAKNYQPIQMN